MLSIDFWDAINISALYTIVGYIFLFMDYSMHDEFNTYKGIEGLMIAEVYYLEWDILGRVRFCFVSDTEDREFLTRFYKDNYGLCEGDNLRVWYKKKRAGIDAVPFLLEDRCQYKRGLLFFGAYPAWCVALTAFFLALASFYNRNTDEVLLFLYTFYDTCKEILHYE